MPFRQQSNHLLAKKARRHQQSRKADSSAKISKSLSQTKSFKLFQSGRLLEPKIRKEVQLSSKQQAKISQKVFTTDESNHLQDSNMNQSIYLSRKMSNDQYFQQPLSFRPKKFKGTDKKKQTTNSKIKNINSKLSQMNQLVRYQEKELNQIKNSMSQIELHRLIKIHKIQKLKLLEATNELKTSSLKNIKKR